MSFILTYPDPGPTPNYNKLTKIPQWETALTITAMEWKWGKGRLHLAAKIIGKGRGNKLFNYR